MREVIFSTAYVSVRKPNIAQMVTREEAKLVWTYVRNVGRVVDKTSVVWCREYNSAASKTTWKMER